MVGWKLEDLLGVNVTIRVRDGGGLDCIGVSRSDEKIRIVYFKVGVK